MLGGASPELLKQSAETLAGRIGYADIAGFDCEEVRPTQWERLWVRGGFPLSFLARSESASLEWRRALMRDFLERELPALGFRAAPETMRRFWSMLAHYHGQIWNASEFARAFGVADITVRRHLDQLVGTFALRAHTGAELDLLVVRGRRRLGIEIKRTSAPSLTPSMRSALSDRKLDSLVVVHAGQHSFPMARRVRGAAFRDLMTEVRALA